MMSVAPGTTTKLARSSSRGVAYGSGGGIGTGSGGGTGAGNGAYRVGTSIPAGPPPPVASPGAPGTMYDAFGQPPLPTEKPDPERTLLESKSSPAILAAFDCWKKSGPDCNLLHLGTLELRVFLTNTDPTTLEQLKALGFTITSDAAKQKVLIGKLPIEKLPELAKLDAVRFISQLGAAKR